jgi:predicted dehydrogenase
MVGFNRRFSAHAQRIRAHFEGRANPLVMSYRVNAGAIPPAHWVQDPAVGGGRILGEACHFVDLLQYVCGAPVVSVEAVSIGSSDSGITNDQSVISLELGDGSVGTVVYAAGGDSGLAKERAEVLGDGKAAILDDFMRTELFSGGRREVVKAGRQDKGFAREMDLFCRGITDASVAWPTFSEIESVTLATLYAQDSLVTRGRYSVSPGGAPTDAAYDLPTA